MYEYFPKMLNLLKKIFKKSISSNTCFTFNELRFITLGIASKPSPNCDILFYRTSADYLGLTGQIVVQANAKISNALLCACK